jgi:hypothetical protein
MNMPLGWRRRGEPATPARVEALERIIGQPLPRSFRHFVLAQDGGEPADNVFLIPGGKNESGVNDFLSLAEIERELVQPTPDGVVPIAHAEGGNLVMLRLSDGRIFFWNHEVQCPEGLIELAPSFAAFREALRPFDISEVRLGPGQVKSAWIDPDLLK